MSYDSTQDTEEHISRVRELLAEIRIDLRRRACLHDNSKLTEPEKSTFDRVTPRLKELAYGSDEYKAALVDMGPALQHHYEHNSHHPEHYANGVNDMSLLDVVEMLCDWKAASERHANGDFAKSLEINKERFGISDQLANILRNTAVELGWITDAGRAAAAELEADDGTR